MNKIFHRVGFASLVALMSGCASYAPMATVQSVDLQRFMGDWYVVGNIPTFLEKDIYNAVENYTLNDDGSIATTFTFRQKSFDGELKTYRPKGYVENTKTNALWGMQFVWPIKADYRIVYLSKDYSTTIIARKQRDYAWLMARTPSIPDVEYEKMKRLIGELGYDTGKLRKVPQQSLQERGGRL